jgi:hypothetical protein
LEPSTNNDNPKFLIRFDYAKKEILYGNNEKFVSFIFKIKTIYSDFKSIEKEL